MRTLTAMPMPIPTATATRTRCRCLSCTLTGLARTRWSCPGPQLPWLQGRAAPALSLCPLARLQLRRLH